MCTLADTVTFEGDVPEQPIELPGSNRPIPTYAYNYQPCDAKATVLILHDVYGAKQLYRDMGKRLATTGFSAILPNFFVREGEARDTTIEAARERASKFSFVTAMQDLETIAKELTADGRKVGVIGFCMGGTLAMLSAGKFPFLSASVTYYGFPLNANPTELRPFNPLDEVGSLSVPLLGLFGEEDAGVGVANVQKYQQLAEQGGKNIDFTIYPKVGHGFLTFDQTSPNYPASRDSWAKTLAFFEANLK
jgi:carboxymethylenebutenolidase